MHTESIIARTAVTAGATTSPSCIFDLTSEKLERIKEARFCGALSPKVQHRFNNFDQPMRSLDPVKGYWSPCRTFGAR